MAQSLSTTDRFSQIPNEVLAIVLTNMPDLVTLNILITAYPSSEDLYQATDTKVLAGTLRQSESLHIQQLDSASYLDLQDISASLLIENIPDPTTALQDIALVTQDIECFTTSFLTPRLRELCAPLHPAFRRAPPSPTDYHQDRHRFWRLQLLSELFESRMADSKYAAHKDSSRNAFLECLCDWELRKLDRTYDYLRERYDVLKLMSPNAPVEA
ncbi:hypothetical protein N7G274_010382 [Stereocaulon virgatum]|uniref:F-box domain-containing protein n=1 Tax=Stereocaulon virgatum TaxID=373712 RepID=A0ABR3ZTL7_9LECA